nr:MAG TPA: periplasmic nitrate reductase [Caudoviricetes sp.]
MSLLSQYCIFRLTRKTVAAVICLLTPIYEKVFYKFALFAKTRCKKGIKKPLPIGKRSDVRYLIVFSVLCFFALFVVLIITYGFL